QQGITFRLRCRRDMRSTVIERGIDRPTRKTVVSDRIGSHALMYLCAGAVIDDGRGSWGRRRHAGGKARQTFFKFFRLTLHSLHLLALLALACVALFPFLKGPLLLFFTLELLLFLGLAALFRLAHQFFLRNSLLFLLLLLTSCT